jgi:hypothetical protein
MRHTPYPALCGGDVGPNQRRSYVLLSAIYAWLSTYMSSICDGNWGLGFGPLENCPDDDGRYGSLLPQEALSAPAPRFRGNRRMRRCIRKPRKAVYQIMHYRHLNARRLSPRQRQERASRLSPLGRVGIYRLKQWGKVHRYYLASCLHRNKQVKCNAPLSPD